MKIPVNALNKVNERINFDVADRVATIKVTQPEGEASDFAALREDVLSRAAKEPIVDAFERFIGSNDLLPVNYLSIGYKASRSVGRIFLKTPDTLTPEAATGILISNRLLITNHHVFPDSSYASEAYLEMDFEYDDNGIDKDKVRFKIQPGDFFHSNEDLDIAFVAVAPRDEKDVKDIRDYGFVVLDPQKGKAAIGEFVSIIQHPNGDEKQIAIRENKILDKGNDGNFIVYEADTSTGSSGAMVCNDQWQIIAVHHMGKAKTNEAGQYIDADGAIIVPDAQNRIDSSKLVWIANEGIRISAILAYLQQSPVANNKFILEVLNGMPTINPKDAIGKEIQPDVNNFQPADNSQNSKKLNNMETPMNTLTNGAVTIQVPLIITVSLGGSAIQSQALQISPMPEADELKKLEDIDYNGRKGYQDNFLGVEVPLPTLNAEQSLRASKLIDSPKEYILKYMRHSIVHNADRKLPFFAVVNIDGSSEPTYHRKDGGADQWFPDTRISTDEQLTDAYYKASGFDHGHMVRREDAVWGTLTEQKMGSDDTFRFTNCVPQVPNLNRSNEHGLWGELEKFVLENGARSTEMKAKISVFNGPVFSDSDPKFRSEQVPLRNWKLVVWKNAEEELKATAFLLSQEDLVHDIKFEEFSFDQEFGTYQISIPHLEKLTKLSFNDLKNFDTMQNHPEPTQRVEDAKEKIIL